MGQTIPTIDKINSPIGYYKSNANHSKGSPMIAQIDRPTIIPLLRQPEVHNPSPTLLYNITWEKLEQLDIILKNACVRLSYIDGILEIMSSGSPTTPVKVNLCTIDS